MKKGEPEDSPLETNAIRRPHPGYPLASCSSAELASVSPEPLSFHYSDLTHFLHSS